MDAKLMNIREDDQVHTNYGYLILIQSTTYAISCEAWK